MSAYRGSGNDDHDWRAEAYEQIVECHENGRNQSEEEMKFMHDAPPRYHIVMEAMLKLGNLSLIHI